MIHTNAKPLWDVPIAHILMKKLRRRQIPIKIPPFVTPTPK